MDNSAICGIAGLRLRTQIISRNWIAIPPCSIDAWVFSLADTLLPLSTAMPALRAALYKVIARLPGVQLLGGTTDAAGRPGVAVAMTDSGIRHQLVFDPHTSALLHREAEELFYILEGELDLLAFEPRIRTAGDWHTWESDTGAKMARGGPGSVSSYRQGARTPFRIPDPRQSGCSSRSAKQRPR